MNPLRFRRPGDPEPLTTTAGQWVLRAERGLSDAEQQALEAWLAEPAHAQAFDDAVWALDTVQSHAASPELLAMRNAALEKRGHSSFRPGLGGIALAAAASLALVWIVPTSWNVADRSANGPTATGHEIAKGPARNLKNGVYRTGVGERSAIVLPDGSVATLDTDSELKVAFTKSRRTLLLARGQAFFDVAKGRPEPFEVLAAGQTITAIGTRFNVRVGGNVLEVAMVEGIVEVSERKPQTNAGPVRAITLRAGERLSSDANRTAHVLPVGGSEVAPWRGGLLVFEDQSLSEAVAEINRYTPTPIRIADPAVGDYRVTGVFKTNDPDRFATAMAEVFPIAVQQRADGGATLSARR